MSPRIGNASTGALRSGLATLRCSRGCVDWKPNCSSSGRSAIARGFQTGCSRSRDYAFVLHSAQKLKQSFELGVRSVLGGD